ncbi:hypothetical protein XM38_024410 [Halomicronema hongdechloris C2206]|uniref:Uncharacterized protein n=1 Tax=Halomicronema hongdechloris C2206 TaxID=1641165 RepID=A0A1Z3HMF5_9CYAN|nr:hypothetical protein [Halomicronema hongdechloris]ASC71489.1 hypothetical protein XM38_024410 [Halomicronema hongdechloris C2206]
MVHFRVCSHGLQWPTIPFTIAGWIAIATTVNITPSAGANQYDTCARDLLAAGVAPEAARTTCAKALHPTELADCVESVAEVTEVAPDEILSACSRDRRPQDMASCVSDIYTTLAVSDGLKVLESCHRSILPRRYSACVTGLADALETSTDDALNSCLSAGYRPTDLDPTFIPAE